MMTPRALKAKLPDLVRRVKDAGGLAPTVAKMSRETLDAWAPQFDPSRPLSAVLADFGLRLEIDNDVPFPDLRIS